MYLSVLQIVIFSVLLLIIGGCLEGIRENFSRCKHFLGYLVVTKDRNTNETTSIFIDFNEKPDSIKPQKWVSLRTQEIFLKEDN